VSEVRWSQQRGPAGAKRLRRRCTDRLEDAAAWVLTALGMFVLLLSVLVGVRTGAEAAEHARVSEHERVRVEAEVLHEAAVPDQDSDADLDWVSVRYIDGAGRVHEAEVPATGPPSAGTTVPMWVDRAGRPAAAPPGALEAVVLGAVVGLGIAAAGGLLLIGAWMGLRRAVGARNATAWAREWETVEPEWSGRRR
jgi:hypothetical protein